MQILEKEILKTLHFYDIFSFSLTPFEIYRNLGVVAPFDEVLDSLDALYKRGRVLKSSGYFYLPQEKNVGEDRNARFLISFEKLKKARRAAALLSRLPFVKFVGVCNSLGFFNATEQSDLDFFIIVKSGHLWTVRFVAASILKLFRLRPTAESSKDKVCLSFFLSDKDLDISRIALRDDDPYLCHWLSWILPIYDDGIYADFIEKNKWIRIYLPNFVPQDTEARARFSKTKLFLQSVFLGSDNLLRKFQLKIMPKNLVDANNSDTTGVVLDDGMLKFHLLDRREEIRDALYQRIKSINV